MSRMTSLTGRLARRGFGDPNGAAVRLGEWPGAVEPLVEALAETADPDVALDGLLRLASAELVAQFDADPIFQHRLLTVLGGSVALGQYLAARPDDLAVLAADISPRSVGELVAELGESSDADQLRFAYRRALLRIATRDLCSADPLSEVWAVSRELSDLADAVVETSLALAKREVPGSEKVRFAVLAMGKCGAQELNYVSDVDVIFVVEPADESTSDAEAVRIGTLIAAATTRICSAHTAAGTIWPLDAALRPEGKAGALVRTMDGMRAYYSQWAKNWEFQALLKARPMAGDLELGQEFVDLVSPMVWRASEKPHFVADAQAMRKRVVSLIPAREQDLEIKLSSGGLRDVEFTVQLLQLVHGRTDERLRSAGTFLALDALIAHGYVGRLDGATLADEYRLQRLFEHRLQLFQLRRTHGMPTDEPGLRRLARSAKLEGGSAFERWRASARTVRSLHQRLFYSPILAAVARVPSEESRLSSAAAETWMSALGFADPRAALIHIESLSRGVSRAAEIQRQLLPAMIGWFAEGPNPDHGLRSFRQVSEAMGSTSWYLRTLRDSGAMAHNFATVLSSSRYVVDLLLRAPKAVSMLADDGGLTPRSAAEISAEMSSMSGRHDDVAEAITVVRAVRRYELLRLAMADILGRICVEELGRALTAVTTATVSAALEIAGRSEERVPRIGVVALGRWGGGEMSYASDADAIFVMEDTDDQELLRSATTIVTRARSLLAQAGPDPALVLDPDLRPEGKGGPLVRTLSSCLTYYDRWSSTWEAQAMLRASYGAGDAELVEAFLAGIDRFRYPASGLSERQVAEIRKLKARMEAERLPRGGDQRRHVKLGPGGLSDIEWTVQLLQLRHAGAVAELRTTETLVALSAAKEAGLLPEADELANTWTFASRVRNAMLLLRGRAQDQLPNDAVQLAATASLLGYAKGEASVLIDDYGRETRRARAVMDKVFWGT